MRSLQFMNLHQSLELLQSILKGSHSRLEGILLGQIHAGQLQKLHGAVGAARGQELGVALPMPFP